MSEHLDVEVIDRTTADAIEVVRFFGVLTGHFALSVLAAPLLPMTISSKFSSKGFGRFLNGPAPLLRRLMQFSALVPPETRLILKSRFQTKSMRRNGKPFSPAGAAISQRPCRRPWPSALSQLDFGVGG